MNQLVFPLVIALAATLATTGCKKGTPKTTPLPGSRAQVGDQHGPETIPPAPPYDPNSKGPGFGEQPGSKELTKLPEFDNMTMDRAALAAYTAHFKFDSAVVQKSDQANIASVAQALSSDPSTKLLIEGHCDERGTEEYNRALGERRAIALREALTKDGVSQDRIRTLSYGKDKPADPGHDDAAWAKNRRGEFILLRPKAGV